MASIAQEARRICPELIDAIKIIDKLAYRHGYNEVFSDLIDWMIWQHLFLPSEENPISKYSEQEQESFLSIWNVIRAQVKERVSLWNELPANWYDPLGRLYECITSKNKSKMLGQYFTPEPVVTMMTQMTNPGEEKSFCRILDPACGSGRMGLAAAAHCMANKTPCWVSMNDLDAICTKMTAVNMCLNGIVGESTCMSGLDILGDSYRFGYQIIPALAQFPQEMWEYYRMLFLMKAKQDIKKQYLLIPISYEQTFLKQANDRLLAELEERKKITEKEVRDKAVNEIKETIQARMKGTLFEDDTSQLENVTLPKSKKSKALRKTKPSKTDGEQQTLF